MVPETHVKKYITTVFLTTFMIASVLLGCRASESKGEGISRNQIRERMGERVRNRLGEQRRKPTEENPSPIPSMTTAGETRTIMSQGIQRTYLLYTPGRYTENKPTPLVIAFHGGRSNPQRLAMTTDFNTLADREGFIVAYPAGVNQNWNDGRASEGLPQQDDVAFVSTMIDHIQTLRSIDRSRIYATGISNGGFMTQRLACELSQKIAAFAAIAATFPAALADRCRPNKIVPILMMHSPDDRFVPWQGGTMVRGQGGVILSFPQTVDFWKTNNKCTSSQPVKSLGQAVEDGTEVTITRFTGKTPKTEVISVRIDGGGHTWPSGTGQPEWLVGKTSQKLNASQSIWDFFKRHSLL
jgi:polyhydroxybutyrate depolymerase